MAADIIFLNGASSAGKSTIARALQRKLEGTWLHVTLDMMFQLLPEEFLADPSWVDRLDWERFLPAFHAAVAQLPCSGFPLILDHVCTSRRWRDQCVGLLKEYRVLHVGVRCGLAEVRRRERARGDRKIGIAEDHLASYEQARPFDVEVDSAGLSAEECADRIIRALRGLRSPTAFERILADL